jgi:opacity protein-like surface antigen
MIHVRRLIAPALVLSAGLVAHAASAQATLPLSFEVRGGVGIPVGDFGDGASTAWSIGGTARYRVASMVDLYAGYDHFDFGADSTSDFDSGIDVGITDDGFRGGARFNLPLAMRGVTPWLEGGLLVNRTTVNVSDGTTSIGLHSKWTPGFEVGAGLAFALSPKISLTPGVRFREHRAEFDTGDPSSDGTVTADYFAIDLGVNFHP